MHRDGHGALRRLLADHVLIHELLELPRRGDLPEHRPAAGDFAFLLAENILAELGAVGADVNIVGPFDHGADFARRLAAEGAVGDLAAAEPAAPATAAGPSAPATSACVPRVARSRAGWRRRAAVTAISTCLIRHELSQLIDYIEAPASPGQWWNPSGPCPRELSHVQKSAPHASVRIIVIVGSQV